MAIIFSCQGCGQRYSVAEQLAGKKTTCKKCGTAITVPTPEPAVHDTSSPFYELDELSPRQSLPQVDSSDFPRATLSKTTPTTSSRGKLSSILGLLGRSTGARLHGLVLIGLGLALLPVGFFVWYAITVFLIETTGGLLLITPALFMAAALALAFVGWLEVLTGIRFSRLARAFDDGGFLAKIGIGIFVIASALGFLVVAVLAFVAIKDSMSAG